MNKFNWIEESEESDSETRFSKFQFLELTKSLKGL